MKIYSEPEPGHDGEALPAALARLGGTGRGALASTRAAGPPAGGAGEIVLVVEDEERVRQFSVEALRDLGYVVVQAEGGGAALTKLEAHPDVTCCSPTSSCPT